MKKLLTLSIAVYGASLQLNAQTLVYNDKLLVQLTKNQAVRLASNESYLNSYEKQKKIYDDVNQKIAQIVAIQEYIYDKLTNVNSAIRQGKQLYYLSKTFAQIGINANDVLSLTAQHPEYAILLNRFYIGATQELLKMQSELTNDILHEENDFLMDPYDRQELIQNLSTKAQMINGYLICIKIRLKNAKKTPYIYQIPTINTYVNLDRMIVKGIIEKYKFILSVK
ncbi:hypothetical protein QGN23_11280 [Chryseobacterium gotjawalense]|uniref:Uncharacterized protein n=1 Tax=Chryseobacterium gotjawalense TaxID=3042315 RepID=A0ABY8RCV7_9FLAO|nr:hypothetical protein [Chryseobacterium sp. wdc7]WHF51008.1 hypothetical protein QGN23_11280 [Chryseobacterium sp. wdc7]